MTPFSHCIPDCLPQELQRTILFSSITNLSFRLVSKRWEALTPFFWNHLNESFKRNKIVSFHLAFAITLKEEGLSKIDKTLTLINIKMFNQEMKMLFEGLGLHFLIESEFILNGFQYLELKKKFEIEKEDALQKIPSYFNQRMDTLQFFNQKELRSIPSNLNRYTQLKKLIIDNAQISSIPERLRLPNLIMLHLGSNKIAKINTFKISSNLTKLYLDKNKLTSISDLITPKLKELTLNENLLIKIPDLKLSSLKTLDLNNNLIGTVDDIKGMPHLEKLYLSYNLITEIANFAHLKFLKCLLLSHNHLTTVPNFNDLNQIDTLNLANNQLRDIPNFEKLTCLKDLNLSDNQIETFRLNLSQLERLLLANNKITSLSSVSKLTNLRTLCVHKNRIQKLYEINSTPYLKSFSIFNKSITTDRPSIVSFFATFQPNQNNQQ